MTNWTLIGPTPLESFFNEQSASGTSIGYKSLDKSADGGTWREYAASWDQTTNRLRIGVSDTAANRAGGFEIGIGGAGSERAIVNIPDSDYSSRNFLGLTLPITIRKGERVSIRLETNSAATGWYMLTGYFDPLFRTDLRYSDLMGKISRSSLTVSDPGGTLHTKGAWSQIVASTSNNYKSLLLLFQNPSNSNTTPVNHLFDIGIGADGVEVVVASDIFVHRFGRFCLSMTRYYHVDAQLNSGVRIAVRSQADNNTDGVRNLVGVAVIGFY